jgi:hypothetical protein
MLEPCAASVGADRPRGLNDPLFAGWITWHADAVVYARVLAIP